MPGENQRSITVSQELYDLLKGLADEDSRSLPGELEFFAKRELKVREQLSELEAFRRGTSKIIEEETGKGGITKL